MEHGESGKEKGWEVLCIMCVECTDVKIIMMCLSLHIPLPLYHLPSVHFCCLVCCKIQAWGKKEVEHYVIGPVYDVMVDI